MSTISLMSFAAAGAVDVTREVPIQYRYVKDIYNGDKRMELNVVPAFPFMMPAPALQGFRAPLRE